VIASLWAITPASEAYSYQFSSVIFRVA